MSVRHIHANPGEYIAVHRNGGSRPTRGGGGSGGGGGGDIAPGCLFVLALFFWREILAAAFWLGVIALVGWLVWKFRSQIGSGLCAVVGGLLRALWWIVSLAWRIPIGVYNAIRGRRQQGAAVTSQGPSPASTNQGSPDYGRIIQKSR